MSFTGSVLGQSLTPIAQGSVAVVNNAPTGNTALYFPGVTGSYLNLGSTSPAHFSTVSSNLFVETWVNFSQNAYTEYIAGSLFSTTTDDWGFRVDGTFNRFMFYHYNTGGSSTAVTAPSGTPVIQGTWYHVAASFVTTGTNGTIYLYVNGVLQNAGGTSIGGTPRYTSSASIFVGTPSPLPGGWVATSGYMKDIRIIKGGIIPKTSFTPEATPWYNNAIPSYVTGGTNVFGLYGQYIGNMASHTNVVGSVKSTYIGTPLFSQLSSAAASSAVGAFSLRAVNGTTALAVNVRRSSDSVTQDFYADRLGNLLTTPVTGQTLANWLGGATGYVTTWYDQSGKGNHATGSGTIAIYQTSNVNMQWAIQSSGNLLTVTSPFITNTNFTIHSITRRTTSSQAPGGGGTAPSNQSIYAYTPGTGWPGTVAYNRITTLYGFQGNRMSFNSVNTSIAQYPVIGNTGCGLYSTSGPVDYLAVIWNGTTTQMYYNNSTSATTAAATFGNIPNTNNFYLLGCPAFGAVVGGEFGEVIVFNSALSASDIATLYSAR